MDCQSCVHFRDWRCAHPTHAAPRVIGSYSTPGWCPVAEEVRRAAREPLAVSWTDSLPASSPAARRVWLGGDWAAEEARVLVVPPSVAHLFEGEPNVIINKQLPETPK